MYQKLVIEYMDGSVEDVYVNWVAVKDDVLQYCDNSGTYGVPLVNIKKYRVTK